MKTVQPIRDADDINAMINYMKEYDERYYIMLVIGLTSALRVGDILGLQVGDVRDDDGRIKDKIEVKADKTGKIQSFMLNGTVRKILKDYCKDKNDSQYLIENRRTHGHIKRVQAWKVLHRAAKTCGIDARIGTHSMRKTYGYTYYNETKNIAQLQKMLGHCKESITMRYIGLSDEQQDKEQLKHLDTFCKKVKF